MKVLLIGGTGTISMAITRLLVKQGHDVYLLNRGSKDTECPDGVTFLHGDMNNETEIAKILEGKSFDTVCEFIGFVPSQVERDYRLFKDKTKQYMYISSASAYQKPLSDYRITEGTPLSNPHWQYSRDKIACEEYLMRMYREQGFPVTIIRPSHTYCEKEIPLGVHGANGSWQVVKRIMEGKPVIIHGDGTSLWTLTHNTDFAKAFVGLIGNIHAIGETYHITSDETVTWNQIYQIIADCLGVELKAYHVSSEFLQAVSQYDFEGSLIGDKANSVVFDNSKVKRAVPDYVATVRCDQGIRWAIDYILQHEECQVEDKEFDMWCDRVIAALEKAKMEV